MEPPFPQMSEPHPWTRPTPLPLPLETERTIIRPWTVADAPSLFEAIDTGRDRLLPWMVWAHDHHRDVESSSATIEQFAAAQARPDCRNFVLGIVDRATGQAIGGTGLHDIRPYWRQAEIGYWLRPDRWGRGIVPEVVRALITSAFTPAGRGGWGLRRILINCAQANTNSVAVCEKLGLRLETRAKDERWVEGLGYHDALGFAVLESEWDREAECVRR